ncbi:exodeoxyribonuclease VII small subunit [Oxalobacter formigenes]|uniref:Exodeoxyribonuclease 7 small subunit n=1 Tax=Oxalobacter formigenes OXCC13 TaxID=556269 RepID=C3XC60_OXAFO|nr:exodeoxyribonuclease VII small subunit [Oxalobacter formigenes]ARQ45042.1 Exodeoxyribonuclease 7 small subunit [Oxalobacter formigenes]ARQ77356.1 exodeoxyribonuclease VII small subunit [Oxalobacter formigenes OXCC13]EEO30786.1 exodeoxyribonuclease VII, small subunit [Oxalobacter formigenes OXCC13]MCZ4063227.1 exodeoxyribonuclease VII small subunit [Oxalobacter formigenes]QDX32106.1 exodeoxyribonuclease VII small subunit [Oxalobacter formigenes]
MTTEDQERKDEMSFEDAIAELGSLVSRLEAGELPLEESIAAYKKGVELVQLCTSRLEKVENQIKILDKELLKPFSSDKSDIE